MRGKGGVADEGGGQEEAVQGFAALKAQPGGGGGFAGLAVAFDVAHIVDVQYGSGEQAAAGGGQPAFGRAAALLQVGAALHAEQAEEQEDADFAQPVVAVGVAAEGVGEGSGEGEAA